MDALEFCALLCHNTERAQKVLRHDVRRALDILEEVSDRSRWTSELRIPVRLAAAVHQMEALFGALEFGSTNIASACLALEAEPDTVRAELLRVEMESLRYTALKALRTLSETLPREVDALNLPAVLAATALEHDDLVVRREVVLRGSSVMDALRELLRACGRAGGPLRDIVRHSTENVWSDLQVVECLNDTVSLALGRGMQFVLGTVDTGRQPFAGTPAALPFPRSERRDAIPDRVARLAWHRWDMSYPEWLRMERTRVRRLNRFVLWNGRGAASRLFLFPADHELGEPILMLGDRGHHPLMRRLSYCVGILRPEPLGALARGRAGHGASGRLLVSGCPAQLRDQVRVELEQVFRKPVVFH